MEFDKVDPKEIAELAIINIRLRKHHEDVTKKMTEKMEDMTRQMESWRTEARWVYKVNKEWADEHLELLDHILGIEMDNLDEALHCVYQRYIKLR